MEEREGFVKNSKIATYGFLNGVFGSVVYELGCSLILSFIIILTLLVNHSGSSSEEMQVLVEQAYNSIPYTAIMSCLISSISLVVFIFIIKLDTFKKLCEKAICSKTVKYGLLAALVIITTTVVYNVLAINIFNLESSGNANQTGVEAMVKSAPFLGFLMVVVLAPITEELTYRYCIFGGLLKTKGKYIAYIVSGLVFMAMHSISSFTMAGGFNMELLKELIYLPPYLLSGLILCKVYDSTDNLGSSFVAHLINNLISFIGIVFL